MDIDDDTDANAALGDFLNIINKQFRLSSSRKHNKTAKQFLLFLKLAKTYTYQETKARLL